MGPDVKTGWPGARLDHCGPMDWHRRGRQHRRGSHGDVDVSETVEAVPTFAPVETVNASETSKAVELIETMTVMMP